MTAVAAVLAAVANDPHRPRLTSYDPDGNRTELSGVPLLNWASKVAGLLVDELGAVPGDLVVVRSRTGWQTAGILLGAWWAGMTVTDEDAADAVAAFVPDGADPAEGLADEVFVVSGHPLGAPSRQVAVHQRDYSTAVMGQADRFSPRSAIAPDSPALILGDGATVTAGDLNVGALAAHGGLRPGNRLLTTGDWSTTAGLLDGLLGPLAAGAGIVHCGDPGLDAATLDRRAASEGATHTRGLSVPGLPPID